MIPTTTLEAVLEIARKHSFKRRSNAHKEHFRVTDLGNRYQGLERRCARQAIRSLFWIARIVHLQDNAAPIVVEDAV